jgi:hypothetical protein
MVPMAGPKDATQSGPIEVQYITDELNTMRGREHSFTPSRWYYPSLLLLSPPAGSAASGTAGAGN